MTVTMNLETRQRALSEWWTEETEYLFRRIEHWAACARGYNRLRTQRISRSRVTMKDENSTSSRWSIAGNKLFIEESSFNPRLQPLNRSHASKSQHEELKLNCCGTLNYRSNAKLDSTCLETYSYDHSIYFKTIGDLKRNKDQESNDQSSENSQDFKIYDNEKIEKKSENGKQYNQLIFIESFNDENEEFSRNEIDQKLMKNLDENANMNEMEENQEEEDVNLNISEKGNQDETKEYFSARRKIGEYQQVAGDEIIWPGVLVSYRKNIDPTSSPHRYVESVSGSDCYFVPRM